MVLSASNTYSGLTIISSGLTLTLTNNGSISHSSLIFFGGADPASVHINASGRADKTLTLTGGQTLSGIGRIDGNLAVAPGAILSPAGTNTTLGIVAGADVIGTISATNAIILNGTTVIELNGSGMNDVVQSTGSGITYGGSLNLTNISNLPLVAGNSFQIFRANNYLGSFADIIPATPGAGLVWDTTQLTSGKLNVAIASPQPVVNNIIMSGNNLIFSGTNGVTNGGFSVLTSTNVAIPLIDWEVLLTNNFSSDGTFHVTNAISPDAPQRFYRIQLH